MMRELELFGQYLLRLRQLKLELAHAEALTGGAELIHIKTYAHEADLCSRIHAALKVLDHDAGKFIQEFLTP